jgi:hypothetical protein
MGTHSPDLVVISRADSPTEHEGERRRRPRLSLSSEQFRIEGDGKTFSVTDISEDGLAIRIIDADDFGRFTIATRLRGTLNLQREKFPVELIVRRVSSAGGGQIGCQFVDLKAEVRLALARCLDPSVLGAELRPIPADGNQIWYHGSSGTDLLIGRAVDGHLYRMTLYLLGTYIQWEEEQGLKTGRAVPGREATETRGIIRFENLVLEADETPDPAKLRIAKTLVLSSNIPQDLKGWCTKHL